MVIPGGVPRRSELAAAALVAAAGLGETWVPFSSRQGHGSGLVTTVGVLLSAAALLWWRRAPVPALAAAMAGWAVVALVGTPYVLFYGTFVPFLLLVFAGTVAASIYLAVTLPATFFPQEDTGQLLISTQARQDISFADMSALQQQVMAKVHHDKFQELGGIKAALNPVANIRVGSQILKEYVTRGGSVEAGLKSYVGAADMANDGGYGIKVLSEYQNLKQVAMGKNISIYTTATVKLPPASGVAASAEQPKPANNNVASAAKPKAEEQLAAL